RPLVLLRARGRRGRARDDRLRRPVPERSRARQLGGDPVPPGEVRPARAVVLPELPPVGRGAGAGGYCRSPLIGWGDFPFEPGQECGPPPSGAPQSGQRGRPAATVVVISADRVLARPRLPATWRV